MSERKASDDQCSHGLSIWLTCYECKVYDAKKISEELENLRAENERLKADDEYHKNEMFFYINLVHARTEELTRVKSAAQKLVAALEFVSCGCSIAERESGHLVGCFMPDFIESLTEWRKEMGDEQKESGNV